MCKLPIPKGWNTAAVHSCALEFWAIRMKNLGVKNYRKAFQSSIKKDVRESNFLSFFPPSSIYIHWTSIVDLMDWKICQECLAACSSLPRQRRRKAVETVRRWWNKEQAFSIPFHFYLTFSYKFLILFLLFSLTKMGRNQFHWVLRIYQESYLWIFNPIGFYTSAPGLQDFKRVGRKSTIQQTLAPSCYFLLKINK